MQFNQLRHEIQDPAKEATKETKLKLALTYKLESNQNRTVIE
jgi:hypothetical protein